MAALWAGATDRAMVTWAVEQIDRLLARDPLGQGESRSGDDRILFVPPLAAMYRVDVANRTVRVFSIGWSGTPV